MENNKNYYISSLINIDVKRECKIFTYYGACYSIENRFIGYALNII